MIEGSSKKKKKLQKNNDRIKRESIVQNLGCEALNIT